MIPRRWKLITKGRKYGQEFKSRSDLLRSETGHLSLRRSKYPNLCRWLYTNITGPKHLWNEQLEWLESINYMHDDSQRDRYDSDGKPMQRLEQLMTKPTGQRFQLVG
jgi:hypothetical protein